MYYLYLLKSGKDGKLFIGVTQDIKKRLLEHNRGCVRSTKPRRPLMVVYLKQYSTRHEAEREEWLLKYASGAGKKIRVLIKEYRLGMGP